MRRVAKRVGLVLAIVFVGIQAIPVDRSNPPVEGDLVAPGAVHAALRRACYDCHSNETRWTWAAYVAPFSWMVASDVREGRAALNFSVWSPMDARQRTRFAREISEHVADGEMPPSAYALMHPAARLSRLDRESLQAWSPAGLSVEGEDRRRGARAELE